MLLVAGESKDLSQQTKRSRKEILLLMMEQILHYLGCKTPCKWDKLPSSTGERRISEPSSQYGTKFFCRELFDLIFSTSEDILLASGFHAGPML